MSSSKVRKIQKQSSAQRKRRKFFSRRPPARFTTLRGECLEERTLLANVIHISLDYTPNDSGAPDVIEPDDFRQVFDLNYWYSRLHPNGITPSPFNGEAWAENQNRLLSILNFNGDGTLDQKDYLGDASKTV